MISIIMTDSFFISLLADHLNGRNTTNPNYEIDWKRLLTLADQHEVRGILYHQCKAFIPAQYRARLAQLYAMELHSYQNRCRLFDALSAALRDAGIPFFTVKGLDVARLYPFPALRTMGDCDIVVREQDKERAHEVFLALGYNNSLKEDMEWTYFKNGLEFELHHSLLYDERGNTRESVAFCKSVWAHVTEENRRFVLDWSFHYVFLLLHLHKHLIHMGVGLRQFMDLYVVARSVSLDWAWIDSELEKLRLLDFSRRCSEMTEAWFGGREMTERDRHCLNQVLCNGAFGFHNEANKENRRADEMLHAKGPHWLTRLRRLRNVVFPPYQNMCEVEHYKGLNGRPWLLPAFWVYRWVRALRYRMFDNGRRMVDNALVSDQEIAARERELQYWGL